MNREIEQMHKGIGNWLITGESGVSSTYIAGMMLGANSEENTGFGKHPYDTSDFGRCYQLIQAVPEIKKFLHLMKPCSPTWSNYIDNWEKMERLYEKQLELGVSCGLYKLMKSLAE